MGRRGPVKWDDDDPRLKKLHSFRIEDELWDEGMIAAAAKGSDMSNELRSFVERMVRAHRKRVIAEKEAAAEARRAKREARGK